MGDRKNIPGSTKPFVRTDNGYLICPCGCGYRHQVTPVSTTPAHGGSYTYLRALILPDVKKKLIDTAAKDGLTISAFVRKVLGWYFFQREQGLTK